ncbi:hypothetical protein PL321_02585 [Caloramator sp. mosi_1]|uniref:hypothetical protein n=1 Tax=Caloramator sp. mosi_1 TaxID=3023090 RepID=UPI0023628AD7|nr:hypothetical protein [Caloramator sp. mosi_1]WDC84614.1 hypothetical protein PL321_02585 [Caloramator sp. mosi_1]
MYDYDDLLEGRLMKGVDPYDAKLRKIMAEEYLNRGRYKQALEECANALYCGIDDKEEILNLALRVTKVSGDSYLSKIIENDIKNLNRKVL